MPTPQGRPRQHPALRRAASFESERSLASLRQFRNAGYTSNTGFASNVGYTSNAGQGQLARSKSLGQHAFAGRCNDMPRLQQQRAQQGQQGHPSKQHNIAALDAPSLLDDTMLLLTTDIAARAKASLSSSAGPKLQSTLGDVSSSAEPSPTRPVLPVHLRSGLPGSSSVQQLQQLDGDTIPAVVTVPVLSLSPLCRTPSPRKGVTMEALAAIQLASPRAGSYAMPAPAGAAADNAGSVRDGSASPSDAEQAHRRRGAEVSQQQVRSVQQQQEEEPLSEESIFWSELPGPLCTARMLQHVGCPALPTARPWQSPHAASCALNAQVPCPTPCPTPALLPPFTT
jgi:hypothetical protein